MSTATTRNRTRNQMTTDYDTSIIFLFSNKYIRGSVTNSEYDDLTLEAGALMGRISATGELAAHDSGASDGSQFPVGVLAESVEILAGDSATVSICVSGEVAQEKLLLASGDTLDTVISGRQLRDRIGADTVGIALIQTEELSGFDN